MLCDPMAPRRHDWAPPPGPSAGQLASGQPACVGRMAAGRQPHRCRRWRGTLARAVAQDRAAGKAGQRLRMAERSEEHTSELQSPDHLVCRLLLEKKKKRNTRDTIMYEES